ncbi:MAG TPA: TMEM175 family protein [Casimicrobiaceae bacterium]
MEPNRLEAFSDGVIAIIITVMVLEMKVPHGVDLASLAPVLPVFLTYVLSYVNLGIYWNNHHHMFKAAESIDGSVLWANLHLLFWLSLLPFTTGWMGENHFERWPAVLYGVNLLCCALAWWVLQARIVRCQGPDSPFAREIGADLKGKLSSLFYVIGIALAWIGSASIAVAFYVLVALMWLVPDQRFARAITSRRAHP